MRTRTSDREAARNREASRNAQGWSRRRPLSANVIRTGVGATLGGSGLYSKPDLARLAQRGHDRPLPGKGGLGISRPRR